MQVLADKHCRLQFSLLVLRSCSQAARTEPAVAGARIYNSLVPNSYFKK